MMRGFLLCAACVAVGVPAHSQGHWLEKRVPTIRPEAMVYDPIHQRTVMLDFAGETWQWNGLSWTRMATTNGPARGPMVYDTTLQRVLLFPTDSGEIWQWTGYDWELRATSTKPLPSGTRLAYDQPRQRVVCVLWGGPFEPQTQTWEFDGASWQQAFPTVDPPIGPIAYDAARQHTVLYAQDASGGTWLWDGVDWSPRPGAGPRSFTALAYDPTTQRVLAVGGHVIAGQGIDETWAWDGNSWTLINSSGAGAAGQRGLAYDTARQRAVLFGGTQGGTFVTDTREWDGNTWSTVDDAPTITDAALAFDSTRGRSILLGSSGQTRSTTQWSFDHWEWDGDRWIDIAAATPSLRKFHALTFDRARDRAVLFGGTAFPGSAQLDDTWEWNGATWSERSPATRPAGRNYASLAFDAARQTVVLFGGNDGSYRNDTWTWDGNDWTERLPANRPPGRSRSPMAFDPARGRMVLFGGLGPNGFNEPFSDTWEWDGGSWVQHAVSGPSARFGHALAYDEARQQVVLLGGTFSTTTLVDAWGWDGTSWTLLSSEAPPTGVYRHMVYDSWRNHLVLVSAEPRSVPLAGLWVHGDFTDALAQEYGIGCGAPAPTLHGYGQPRFANASYAIEVQDAQPNQPLAYLLAIDSGNVPLGGGCALLLAPSLYVGQLPAVTSPAGTASLPLPIPSERALDGAEFVVQAVVLGASRIDLTGGLRTRVGE